LPPAKVAGKDPTEGVLANQSPHVAIPSKNPVFFVTQNAEMDIKVLGPSAGELSLNLMEEALEKYLIAKVTKFTMPAFAIKTAELIITE
jgi:hypothetical protein